MFTIFIFFINIKIFNKFYILIKKLICVLKKIILFRIFLNKKSL